MSSGRIAPRSWRVRTAASPKRSRKPWRSSTVAPARSAWVTRRRVASSAPSYSPRRLAAPSEVAHPPSGSRPAGEANQPGAGPSERPRATAAASSPAAAPSSSGSAGRGSGGGGGVRGVAAVRLRGGGGLGGQAPQLGGREAPVAAARADDVDATGVGPAPHRRRGDAERLGRLAERHGRARGGGLRRGQAP